MCFAKFKRTIRISSHLYVGIFGVGKLQTTSRYSRLEPDLPMSEGSVQVYPAVHRAPSQTTGMAPLLGLQGGVSKRFQIFSSTSKRQTSFKQTPGPGRPAKPLVTPPKRKPVVKIDVVEVGQKPTRYFGPDFPIFFHICHFPCAISVYLSPREVWNSVWLLPSP